MSFKLLFAAGALFLLTNCDRTTGDDGTRVPKDRSSQTNDANDITDGSDPDAGVPGNTNNTDGDTSMMN